jgi:hypothetical protein
MRNPPKNLFVLTCIAIAAFMSGCASAPDAPAYPSFVISEELPDLFLATLPGVRAKEFSGDARTRSVSNRIDLPESWTGTTGGAPGKALEIFVLAGELKLADISLTKGGYAYVPPGSLGFNMQTDEGARVLYFLSDFDSDAVIGTPLILDSALVEWKPTDSVGVFSKELRFDPGNKERTWLLRYEPGAQTPWQSSSAMLEGYLISGQFQDSECVPGGPYTDIYLPGGYFRRPADTVHGGPDANALTESIWFLRERRESSITFDVTCAAD